ncbi:Muscleblind-like protein [Taenia solium]|eukprot:TsM_000397600 transcript=TsM_000397600 gene=TsM_000397600
MSVCRGVCEMFRAGYGSNVPMNPLNGCIPPNAQSPSLYTSLPPPPPPSVNPQPPVMPLAIRPPPKVTPAFSTLQVSLKSTQLPPNNTVYNPVGSALVSPSSPAVVSALSPNPTAVRLANLASAVAAASVPVRDSTWLKMRVCPAFFKEMVAGGNLPDNEKCPFTSETCSLAHPQPNVRIENESVTVCFDFIKRNECRHTNCKYYHPPKHHTEAVLKRGDMTKKSSASHGAQVAARLRISTSMARAPTHQTTYLLPISLRASLNAAVHTNIRQRRCALMHKSRLPMQPQTSLAGLCWPGGAVTQSSLMLSPAAQANSTVALAMLAAMRGTGPPSAALYSPAATSMYTALPDSANLASLISGYYPFPASASSASPSATAVANSAYNPTDILSGGASAATSLFSPGGQVSPATYAAAVAAVNASRQAAAIQPPPPSSSQPSISVTRAGEDLVQSASSRKREAPGDKDAQVSMPPKRIHTTNEDITNSSTAVNRAPQIPAQPQLAFNTWLQQQQQQQLSSPPPPSLPTATSPTVALQAAALMRLQQQQQQQQWAAMAAGYGPLSGFAPNSAAAVAAAAAAAYSNPAALFDPLTFQSSALTTNPYATSLLQSQTLLTNVAYINDEGQLLESLPICRDFKAGKCHRNTECRYVHLIDENVEVNQGRVTVCRDAAKGRCSRVPCKYYHIPLFAISASRSLALNSALSAAVAANAFSNTAAGTVAASPGTGATSASSLTNGTSNNPPPPQPPSTSASL